MLRTRMFGVTVALLGGMTPAALAGGKNVAVIDFNPPPETWGEVWCDFLIEKGYACTLFPKEGPTSPLDPFDVVVDLSSDWSDPTGTLVDFMQAGKTVITAAYAPHALGIDLNATVQAWIGANRGANGSGRLLTTVQDPILGNIPPGAELDDCADSVCPGVNDISGHPDAKVLARFGNGTGTIGMMRNFWEGGISVYLGIIGPGTPINDQIVLNAVGVRTLIPTLSRMGLIALALTMGIAGALILRHRRWSPSDGHRGPRSPARAPTIPVLLAASFLVTNATALADVTQTQQAGVTYLRLVGGEPFHSTGRTVANLRSVAIPNSPGTVVLWEETDATGVKSPLYAISLDGTNVDTVEAASYDLALRFARFDPAVQAPTVPATLTADADSELHVVQFVTQPLSAFRASVEAQGATIYDFLPNHAYIVKIPPQARAGVETLPFVRAVAPYHPAYRLEKFLRDNLDHAQQLFPLQRYNIRVFAAGQKTAVAARIAAGGGVVDSADAGNRLLAATLTPQQLLQVVAWNEVAYIDRWSPMAPDMNNVRIIGGANYIEQTPGNYRGAGVRGEVFDCGFNFYVDRFGSEEHGDLVSRLTEHGGSVSRANHGASTSGIIFGDGTGIVNARGLLPLGQGFIADWDNVGFFWSSRHTHTGQLVDPLLTYKAVFQSTSGGSAQTTDYTNISADMDDIFFDFDLVHCQSQSNCGGSLDNCGACTDPRCSRPEAWAKNTISVGGVKHCNNTDSTDDRWCGGSTSCDTFPDNCASVGPAADGRVKPDLVGFYESIHTTQCCSAPGSCSGCSSCSSTSYTPDFDGTSAATPIVCGHAGLVMEMWADDSDADGKNIFGVSVLSCNPATENCVFKRRPHMTTAKAMLINRADQYDWVANPPPHPNGDLDRNKQGWGRPNVKNIYDLRQKMVIIDESIVLSELTFVVRTVKVYAGEAALKATLVYADPPGALSPAPALVNDLSLKVTSPSNVIYWGNRGLHDGIWSTPGGADEAVDNVENVFVQNPEAGLWTIRVRADALAQDGHTETPAEDADFALVVSGVYATGACTLPGGGCIVTDLADCLAQGGTFLGDNVACN